VFELHQAEDVAIEDRPAAKAAAKSKRRTGKNRLPKSDETSDGSGLDVLAAAMAFAPDTESRYLAWSATEYSQIMEKPGHVAGSESCELTEQEWLTLSVGIQMALLCGDTSQEALNSMASRVGNRRDANSHAIRTMLAFFSHQPQQTIECYQKFSKSQKDGGDSGKAEKVNGAPHCGLAVVVYALALIQQTTQQIGAGNSEHYTFGELKQLESLVDTLNTVASRYQSQHRGDPLMPVLRVLTDFMRVVCGQRKLSETIWLGGLHIEAGPWLDLFLNLTRHWLGEQPDEQLVERLARHVERASDIGLHWYVDEGLTLLSAQGLHRPDKEFQPQIRSTGWLLTVYRKQADWKAGLDALTLTARRHVRIAGNTNDKVGSRRLGWWLEADGSRLHVEPREQRLARNNSWNNGRRFPLKLLLDECGTLDFLCEHDLKICAHLRNQMQSNHALYFEKRFEFCTAESLDLIFNHPRLYRENPDPEADQPLRVSMRESQTSLQVDDDKALQEIKISMQPFPHSDIQSMSDFFCQWQDPNILSVQRYTEGQLEIAHALTYKGLSVPSDSSDEVLDSLRSMAALLEVHTDIDSADANTVEPQNCIAFHLRPLETGLDVAMTVYPLGEHGPFVVPGEGKTGLYTVIDNQPCNIVRDLDVELATSRSVLEKLPLPECDAGWRWSITNTEQSLEVLAALQELGDTVMLRWPAGERIVLSREIDSEHMHVHFSGLDKGIDVAGELKIDKSDRAPVTAIVGSDFLINNKRVDLQKLLASLGNAEGRFIPLDSNRILQLSRRLRMQVDALGALSADGVTHELCVPMLEELSRGMVLQHDDSWDEQLQRWHEAQALVIEPPLTLQAKLRDYQLEGFRWMARLAHWGAGACLADDMGLGKTMQSLALMLLRANGGPALVIAPTSVCGNWIAEARTFAPSLQMRWLGDSNREKLIREAKAGDLFVCSYGVLQNDIELLQETQWHTIVADEAQSFKNAGTRRSQAMMALRADFRLIATGTPIENHLGELWNLFRFINPGLLGSSAQFKDRYAAPIEQRDDDMARSRLKSLISPFILRRLKREVLTELPERTEITHLVEFNEEERQFYEGLKKQALQRISELANLDSEQRFRVLAEITTLRQASCHPALVTDDPPCDSAKLREFGKIVDELRRNGHRCLVFSQFVGHLSLIRNHLDSKGIVYQYLDGSTSVKNRKRAVDAFQAGEGELFLISLKAGGSGLNLTAADYVIHMDPWWNPAVEDQASDRAYRMGQKRPVTIYRMVVKDSIEEKIVNLHERKRDLANALLEGTDSGSRLSVEELVEMIEED